MATPERLIIESMFRITNKAGEQVDFVLNSAQAALDARFTGRDIVPKARQEGISTYVLGRFLARCITVPNTRAVVISHESVATEKLFQRVHYMIDHMRGGKPVVKSRSKHEISFPKTGSTFYIGTAGAKKFGRGDTITNLHCSEVAYWDDPQELTTGLFQSVPHDTGEIIIESTGNGVGNWYHNRCLAAWEGRSRYRCHFFNWQDFPEYNKHLTPEQEIQVLNSLDPDLDEPAMVEYWGLTAGQLLFRREKLEELDWDLRRFRQEYPLSFDECFQASGDSIFYRDHHVDVGSKWERKDTNLFVLHGHPYPDRVYAIGADVAGGVGKDNSVAFVMDVEAGEQVAEFASNKIAPDLFAHKLDALGRWFNEAMIGVESNNHGILTLSELEDSYTPGKLFMAGNEKVMRYGLRTTSRTKPLWVGLTRKAVAEWLVTHSPLLRGEMTTFIENEHGKLGAAEGCNDDRVIAMVMAVVVADEAALTSGAKAPRPVVVDPFTLEGIIKEFEDRHQARGAYKRQGNGFSAQAKGVG